MFKNYVQQYLAFNNGVKGLLDSFSGSALVGGLPRGLEALLQDPREGDTDSETTLAKVSSVNRHKPQRTSAFPTVLLPTIPLAWYDVAINQTLPMSEVR